MTENTGAAAPLSARLRPGVECTQWVIDAVRALEARIPKTSEVTRQLIERDQSGRAKYGTTLDRTDLSPAEWLQHMAEELLDGAGYALACRRELLAARPVAWEKRHRVLPSAENGHAEWSKWQPCTELVHDNIKAARALTPYIEARALCVASDAPAADSAAPAFDFGAYLKRHRDWSAATFGPGPRTAGLIDHITKELREIEADPLDGEEWIDIIILGLDGAWRAGLTPEQITATLSRKQDKNVNRKWPDWRTADPNKAIEHDRSGEVRA